MATPKEQEQIREQLEEEKENKVMLDFTKPELEYIKENANFTIEELTIFEMLTGKYGRDRKNKANIKARGEKSPFHKLTSEQVKEIYLSKLSYKKMSKIYNVSTTNINLIKHKKSWQWLTNTLD